MQDRCTSWDPFNHGRVSLLQSGVTEEFDLWLADLGEQIRGGRVVDADPYTFATAHALVRLHLATLDKLLGHADPDLRSLLALVRYPEERNSAGLRSGDVAGGKLAEAQVHARINRVAGPAAPRPPEDKLARVLAAILNVDSALIRVEDNLFDLGGDSFIAKRAVEATTLQFGLCVDRRRNTCETLAQLEACNACRQSAQNATAWQAAPAATGLLGRICAALGCGKPS